MIGRTNVSGGGLNINGIIEEYVAGGNISAGKFVKYINEYSSKTNLKFYNEQDTISMFSAVALSENKVFITHGESYLYGLVCSINNDTITIESDTKIDTNSNPSRCQAVLVSENKVFILEQMSYYPVKLYGIVCIVNNDNTITFGTITELADIPYSTPVRGYSLTTINENKIFMTYSNYNDSQCLYAKVCIISDMSITVDATQKISTNTYSGNNSSCVKLEENKVVIVCYYNQKLASCLCTISSGSISTPGTYSTSVTLIDYNGSYSTIKTVQINKNKIIALFDTETTNYYLYGMVITIDTRPHFGTSTQLSSTKNSGKYISTTKNNKNDIFVIYSAGDYEYATISIINENDNVLSLTDTSNLLNTKQYSGRGISLTLLNNKKLFSTYTDAYVNNTTYYYNALGGVTINYVQSVSQLSSSTDKIFGVSNTSASTGENIKIYVPEVVS